MSDAHIDHIGQILTAYLALKVINPYRVHSGKQKEDLDHSTTYKNPQGKLACFLHFNRKKRQFTFDPSEAPAVNTLFKRLQCALRKHDTCYSTFLPGDRLTITAQNQHFGNTCQFIEIKETHHGTKAVVLFNDKKCQIAIENLQRLSPPDEADTSSSGSTPEPASITDAPAVETLFKRLSLSPPDGSRVAKATKYTKTGTAPDSCRQAAVKNSI